MNTSSSIDSYIKNFPKDVQVILEKVRQTIAEVAPQAEQTIGYGIPTFKLNGNLVHFGGFAHHVGFYPGPGAIEEFMSELGDYEVSKGTIKFPLDKPIPYPLIKKITAFRVKKNLAKKK